MKTKSCVKTKILKRSPRAKAKPAVMRESERLLFDGIFRRDPQAVLCALDAGADVNMVNPFSQRPPLVLSIAYGAPEITRLLLSRGADWSYAGSDGNTPLHYAMYYRQCEAADALLSYGADCDMRNIAGETPLFVAAVFNYAAGITMILQDGADTDIPNCDGNTPLMEAALSNDVESVTLLIESGADCEARNSAGRTIFDFAEESSGKNVLNAIRREVAALN